MRPNTDPKSVISRRSEKDPSTGCWIWRGAKGGSRLGYGVFRLGGPKVYAHRASYEAHKGHIPGGMEVCHSCDTPSCVNPDHLFLGSHADNMADMASKDRLGRALSDAARKGAKHLYYAERRSVAEIARHFRVSYAIAWNCINRPRPQPKPAEDSKSMPRG